jgi:ParB family chromosome partitioning protein
LGSQRPAFRENIQRLFDEAVQTDLSPGIVSLIESQGAKANIRDIPVDRILPNPAQPRLSYEEEALSDLAASIREHGVLQPILVRPAGQKFELIAGERRWRASQLAERGEIPAIVVDVDERTALEVSIIENLQREDLTPIEESNMYRRLTVELGYSVRSLAQKIGKDKGYVENRLRLVDAPPDVRELVSLRKDTVSHAYELMKIPDERLRRRLAARVANGELSLAKLRQRIGEEVGEEPEPPKRRGRTKAGELDARRRSDDSLLDAKGKLAEAVDELVELVRQRDVLTEMPDINRDNFAKYLTVTKLKLENAIAILRSASATAER